MSLSEVDRELLQRCLDGAPQAWQRFVDRFIGLVVHVTNHTAASRSIAIDAATRDDLVAEVFLTLVDNDFRPLRRFRRNCSLATYLTVIARRVVVRRLHARGRGVLPSNQHSVAQNGSPSDMAAADTNGHVAANNDATIIRRQQSEEIEHLMSRLDPQEQSVVRMFHLEGKTYREIGDAVGLSENSIGPLLSRAKAKMRA